MKNTTKELPQNGTLKKSKRNIEKEEHGSVKGLRNLFIDELQGIYRIEKALTKAIPKMIKNATGGLLVETLTRHFEITKEHVTRLEEAFSSIGEKAETNKRKTISGLIKQAKTIMKETEGGMVRDAAIISAAKKIEHYEIATYGTLCFFAEALGETEAAGLLHEILIQEKAADEKLSEIAEFFINSEAADINEDAVGIISISVLKQTQLD